MRIGLWCRSDESVGGGHLGRMLALAGAIRERGDEAVLLLPSATRAFAAERIADHDIAACENPASPPRGTWDWVCFDDYAVGRVEETAWRGAAGRLLVVDDLVDRPHDCDALVDPQPYRRAAHYDGLLPSPARRWIGPAYAPVSPTVAGRRAASLEVRKGCALRRVVVSFGMARNRAPYDAALKGLALAGLDLEVVCLVADPEIADSLRHAHAGRVAGLSVRPTERDPSAIFAAADLVIGTPGVTTLELCVLGVPMILLVLRDIQSELGKAMAGRGCARVFTHDDDAVDAIARALGELAHPGVLGAMSAAAAATADGRGAARIVEGLAAICREAA